MKLVPNFYSFISKFKDFVVKSSFKNNNLTFAKYASLTDATNTSTLHHRIWQSQPQFTPVTHEICHHLWAGKTLMSHWLTLDYAQLTTTIVTSNIFLDTHCSGPTLHNEVLLAQWPLHFFISSCEIYKEYDNYNGTNSQKTTNFIPGLNLD